MTRRSRRIDPIQGMFSMHFRFREYTDEQLMHIIANPLTLPLHEQVARAEMERRLKETRQSAIDMETPNALDIIDI